MAIAPDPRRQEAASQGSRSRAGRLPEPHRLIIIDHPFARTLENKGATEAPDLACTETTFPALQLSALTETDGSRCRIGFYRLGCGSAGAAPPRRALGLARGRDARGAGRHESGPPSARALRCGAGQRSSGSRRRRRYDAVVAAASMGRQPSSLAAPTLVPLARNTTVLFSTHRLRATASRRAAARPRRNSRRTGRTARAASRRWTARGPRASDHACVQLTRLAADLVGSSSA